MYQEKKVAVVIPVYNEEKFVVNVVNSIPGFIDQIVIIDDASRDKTAAVVDELRAGDPRIVLLALEKNEGVGGAMLAGYRYLLSRADMDIAVKMDGDGQMSVSELPSLIDPLIDNTCEYSKGNRFLNSDLMEVMPTHRLVGNFLLTLATKLASGYWNVFDSQNGFTAVKLHCLKRMDLNRISKRYFFENDMLINLNIHNYRVSDIPIPVIYGEEKSDIKVGKDGATILALLIKRFFYRIYHKYVIKDFSPIALFLFLGIFFVLSGSLFGLAVWAKSLLTGIQTPTGTIILGLLPIILGFQLTLQGIVLDIQETPR